MLGYIVGMNRAEVIQRLRSVEPALRSRGVAALFLFGSYARGEARPDSDIDIFVDPDQGRRFGFDEFMDSYETLKAVLSGHEIGFSTRDGIDRYIRPAVERDALRVF
jgi:predicted nucleotidyltransferase